MLQGDAPFWFKFHNYPVKELQQTYSIAVASGMQLKVSFAGWGLLYVMPHTLAHWRGMLR